MFPVAAKAPWPSTLSTLRANGDTWKVSQPTLANSLANFQSPTSTSFQASAPRSPSVRNRLATILAQPSERSPSCTIFYGSYSLALEPASVLNAILKSIRKLAIKWSSESSQWIRRPPFCFWLPSFAVKKGNIAIYSTTYDVMGSIEPASMAKSTCSALRQISNARSSTISNWSSIVLSSAKRLASGSLKRLTTR